MKNIIMIALMLFTVTSFAQVVDLRDSASEDDLLFTKGTLELDLKLHEEKRPALEQRAADLEWSVGRFQEAAATWRARCDIGTSPDPDFIAGCYREQGELQQQKSSLQMIQNNLRRDAENFNNRYYQLTGDIAAIERTLASISSQNDECDEAIIAFDGSSDPFNDGTMERMKAVCGSMFDGN